MLPLEPGDPEEVGGYRLLGRLGSGATGVVFLAEVPGTEGPPEGSGAGPDGAAAATRVAVKVLRPELADDPGLRTRLAREAEALRRVESPYVVRVMDVDAAAPRPYVVMEYVDGPSLDQVVGGGAPLDEAVTRRLAAELAAALAAVHASGLIHRDLKPSNVILGKDRARLVDFGIASALWGSETLWGQGTAMAGSLTRTGWFIGTQSWAAPEQLAGTSTSPAVDVFAWGLVVAWAATGRHPYGEGRSDAVMYRIVHERPDLSAVPPSLLPAVTAALDPDPGRRPHAATLATTLHATLAGDGTTMVSPAPPHPGPGTQATAVLAPGAPVAAHRNPRHRAVRIGALIAVVLVLVLGAALLSRPQPTTVTLDVRPTAIAAGDSVTASGTVTPGADRTVVLETSDDGQAWRDAAEAVTTDDSGAYEVSVQLLDEGRIQVRAHVAEARRAGDATSEVVTLTVSPPPTEVVLTDPFDAAGVPLASFDVTEAGVGVCRGSPTVGGAYECLPGGSQTSLNPCFRADAGEGPPLCIEDPRGGPAVQIANAAVAGRPGPTTTAGTPWYVLLEGEVGCRLSPGAEVSLGGTRQTYACEDGRVGFGVPDRSTEAWSLQVGGADAGGAATTDVRVVTAWF